MSAVVERGSTNLSTELSALKPEIEKVLPAHVTPDKFMRVVMTAISQSPELYHADRRSLLTSAVKAAQDGLLPDGRDAAFVIFNSKEKVTEGNRQVERWVKKVQYMPMVAGILKKVRNSGELLSIVANVVFERDEFRYWVDDAGEHVTHEPNVLADDRGRLIAVYAIAKTKTGGVYVEVMSRGQIEQVREVSKSKDSGPWKSWYDEMARKTVIRRLSKRLPMSTDLESVIRRDDELYDLNGHSTRAASRSGNEAAKALLGLSPALMERGGTEITGQDHDGTGLDDEIPHYDDASALQAIKEAGTAIDLEKAWQSLAIDYGRTKREIPIEVEAVYNDRKEELGRQEK